MKSLVYCQLVTVDVLMRQRRMVLSEPPDAMQNYFVTLKIAQETIPLWASSWIGPLSFKFQIITFMSAPAVNK